VFRSGREKLNVNLFRQLTLLLFALWQVQTVFEPPRLQQIAPVEHNVNIIGSSWVIGDVEVAADGGVKSAITQKGHEPLNGAVLSSVSRWQFTPAYVAAPVESHVTAVFLFRARDIFSSTPPDLSGLSVAGLNRPPTPITLSDPGYMANSIAEGQVVLELHLSETGAIQDVRVVNDVSGLTEFTERAVRSWRFAPSLWNGRPVPGTVVAVVSYLRPAV
jgi:TonB-like protein